MEFLLGFGSFFFPFGFLLLGLIVLAVIAIVGRRATPDPTGHRPMAVYLLAVMFVTLLSTAGAVSQMGRTLALEAINEEPVWAVTFGTSFRNYTPLIGPETTTYSLGVSRTWSEILRPGAVGLLAAAIFEFHRRQWKDLLRREIGDG